MKGLKPTFTPSRAPDTLVTPLKPAQAQTKYHPKNSYYFNSGSRIFDEGLGSISLKSNHVIHLRLGGRGAQAEAQRGAGFSLDIFDMELSFAAHENYYREELEPVTRDFSMRYQLSSSSYSLTLNGAARTPQTTYRWEGTEPVRIFHFGVYPKGSGLGYNEFNIIRH